MARFAVTLLRLALLGAASCSQARKAEISLCPSELRERMAQESDLGLTP